MKIAIFSDTFPPIIDGVANVAAQSAAELTKLGHEVYVITCSESMADSDNIRMQRYDGFTLIRLPSVPAMIYSGHRFAIPMGLSYSKLRKIRPDIIHTHTPFSIGWEAIWTAKLLKVPLIGTHHTFYDQYLKHAGLDHNWARKASWKYMVGYYNWCDLVLSPSKSLGDALVGHGLKKPVTILANPVDTESFCPVDSDKQKRLKKQLGITGKSIVYMGRVSYEKNISQAIRAVGRVAKAIPDIQFVIVGDGPERPKLEKLTKSLNLDKNIIFLGFKHNQELVESLQANDIFLTASQTENMPVSVLDAMAAGLPIVGVNALGIPEIVRDKENGLLAKPNSADDLASKIISLISDDKLMLQLGRKSREMSLVYSQEKITKNLAEIYQSQISKYENLPLSRI